MLGRILIATGLLLACQPAWTAEWKPVAVVSFTGWEELVSDIEFLGLLTQNGELAATLGKALASRTGVQSLEGLDPRRPCGALVETDGLRVHPIAFFPVTSLPRLLASLAPLMGEPQVASPGVWKIGQRTLTGYVREKDGWAYVAQSADLLERLPDPPTALGDLPQKYDLAFSFYPANLPEALRTLAIDEVRNDRRLRLAGPPADSKDAPGLPLPLAGLSYASAEEMFTDVQRLTLGWRLDQTQKAAALDLTIVPLLGSDVARRWNNTRSPVSAFAGGAAENVAAEFSLTALPRARYQELSMRYAQDLLEECACSRAQQRLALICAAALGDVLDDAQQATEKEAAIRIYGTIPHYTIVAALRLRDAGLVERRIQQMAAAAQGEDTFLRIKPDMAKLETLRVHALEIVGAEENDLFTTLLGQDRTVYVATRGPHLFLACGHRALAAIEKSLPGDTPRAAEAVTMQLRLGAALTAVARTTQEQGLVPILTLAALSLQAGDDRLIFTANTNSQGLRARLECREAVLRAAALTLNLFAAQSKPATRPGRSP